MKNLIKFSFLFFFIISTNVYGLNISKIIFTFDNNIYTSIDLEKRKKYNFLREGKKFINEKDAIDDFILATISSYFFDLNINENSELEKLVKADFEKNFKKFENLKDNNIFKETYLSLDEKDIIKNIQYDYKKKIIIERRLNQKRNEILTHNLDEIYSINIKYFLLDNANLQKLRLEKVKLK